MKTVSICGIPHTIEEVPVIDEEREGIVQGEITYNEAKIRIKNDLPYEIIPQREQITGLDGKPVTVDDLYRAAELEISTVEELCAIRNRYGSLEQFLKIDTLTEQKGTYYE